MRQIKDSREHGKRTETENMMKEYIICLQEHKEWENTGQETKNSGQATGKKIYIKKWRKQIELWAGVY